MLRINILLSLPLTSIKVVRYDAVGIKMFHGTDVIGKVFVPIIMHTFTQYSSNYSSFLFYFVSTIRLYFFMQTYCCCFVIIAHGFIFLSPLLQCILKIILKSQPCLSCPLVGCRERACPFFRDYLSKVADYQPATRNVSLFKA